MKPAVSVREAATLLGCSKSFALRAFNRGELPGYRIGKCARIFTDSIDTFIRRHAVGPKKSRHGI
jgi:excisionase family DNA binding protein